MGLWVVERPVVWHANKKEQIDCPLTWRQCEKSVAILKQNKALRLAFPIHITFFNQAECISSRPTHLHW